jgi:hypothetical protein
LNALGKAGLPVLRNDARDSAVRPAENSRQRVPKGYETVDSILLTEPRIEAIRRELQALLAVVQLESGGEPLEVDGFRLRNPAHWADYPSSLSDIFWHLSSVCNFSCEFCYEKGNPPDFPIQNLPRMATADEIETRLRYYDPAHRCGIFTVRTAINEPFANRRAIEFLRRMREKSPTELISFVTNGAYLTEDVVRALKELQPLFFNLSIYSTDREIRRRILGDHRPDRAVEAVDILARHRIPYMTNLVMWPSIPFSDMERTIAYMAERQATVLRVCLGGYSRYLEGDWERFSIEGYWPRVVEEVERLRERYSIPLLIEPNTFVRYDTESVIDGVIQGSPAGRAGLRRGDLIRAVNGQRVNSRMQLLSELRRSTEGRSYRPPGVVGMTEDVAGQGNDAVTLEVERDGDRFEAKLDRYEPASMRSFPYGQIAQFHDFMFGLVLTDCLRYSSIKSARQLMEKHRARQVLLLTSTMIRPMVGYMLERTQAFDGFDVAIRVAQNRYFGGTINVGDLLVVQDFIDAVRAFLDEGGRPVDLVLIPASPFASSPWGRDLTGRPWQEIERAVGVPVDLIPCPNITF